jgi:hypothetical protein
MAVLQISRIQQRRGLQQDLPQLASAEFGWSIDQRRLFIGNGLLGEGAPVEGVTEILTQHTDLIDVIKFYIFKGEEGGFTSLTGPSLSAPTVRSLQHKFDDFVSVRDFGAIGDGVTNDIDSINRAIQNIYDSTQTDSNPRARRTIYFPAGTYNIGASALNPYGVILAPTWLRIVGEGIDSTKIVQTDSSMDYVLRFTDTAFKYGVDIGATPFITMPTDICIENLSLQQANNKDVVFIDNAVNVNFRLVKFGGVADWTVTPSIAYAGVSFGAAKVEPTNVTFELCKFTDLGYAVVSDVASTNVRFHNCYFNKLFSAFRLGQNSIDQFSAPQSIRITNSTFKDIKYYAIDSYPYATGIVSTGNSYHNVNGTGTAISFQSDGNYSINDYFDVETNRISYNNKKFIQLQANVGAVLGTATIGTGGVAALTTVGTPTTTGITLPAGGVMNYSVAYPAGTVFGKFTFSGTEYVDEFTAPTGFVPTAIFSIQGTSLMYKNAGSGVSLRYNINHF